MIASEADRIADMFKPEQLPPHETGPEAEFQRQQEVFSKHLPDAAIEPMALADMPEQAVASLEEASRYLVHPDDYAPGNFERLFVITHDQGSRTFVAQQTKKYGKEGDTEKLIHLVDLDEDGADVGHGEIRMNISNPSEYFADKPFVGFTKTAEGKQRKGAGLKRIRVMNALTHMLYALPLHSDTLMSPEAKRLWEKLASQGEAEKYLERQGGKERYVFTDDPVERE